MFRITFILFLGMLCLSQIAGCTSKRSLDYLQSRNGKILNVPAPLSHTNISRQFVLPNVAATHPASIEPSDT